MAKRRAWNALSSSYQARLVRGGITKDAYESGASLSKARGHANTPEHPEDAIKQPSRYQKYRAKLKPLQQQVWTRKENLFERNFKWHEGRAREWVKSPSSGRQPGIRIMKQFLAMSDDEIYQKASDAGKDYNMGYGIEDDWYFLFYH
jgi:hypothetical protein